MRKGSKKRPPNPMKLMQRLHEKAVKPTKERKSHRKGIYLIPLTVKAHAFMRERFVEYLEEAEQTELTQHVSDVLLLAFDEPSRVYTHPKLGEMKVLDLSKPAWDLFVARVGAYVHSTVEKPMEDGFSEELLIFMELCSLLKATGGIQ